MLFFRCFFLFYVTIGDYMYTAIIISHFFILMCCFYCYCKILNLNDLFFRLRILFTFSALALACALCFIHFIVYPIAMFFVLLTFYIFIALFTKTNWHTSLNAAIISIAMSFFYNFQFYFLYTCFFDVFIY